MKSKKKTTTLSQDDSPRKQLELIYAGEIRRLFNRFPKNGGLSDEDVRRLVELTKGIKELEAIPDRTFVPKEIKDATTDELMEIVRSGQTRA